MAVKLSPAIAVIICSSRQPRACPQIASFVQDTLQASLHAKAKQPNHAPVPTLHTIDLAKWDLPMLNEPKIPSQVHKASDYFQPHSRAWSEEIQKYSAFIFVTPQYNWGYPAVLKNAIDYLFNEWKGKSAMIVSYGGHGGGKSAGQLRQVLQGVRLLVVETMPAFTFPSQDFMVAAATGQKLDLEGEDGIWASERPTINKAFEELLDVMSYSPDISGV